MKSPEFDRWLAKYEPVERQIINAREKYLAAVAKRNSEHAKRFGDLCEATEGLAVVWRRKNWSIARQFAAAGDDLYTLQCLARYHRVSMTRRIDRMRHALKRPFYYEAENARRRAAASERRKIRRRTTENPCPTREEILDAWIHRNDSHASAIFFGGMIEDLECYLDNSLRLDEGGAIIGRNGGIKRWLQSEIPALFMRYTTVMRYKSAARKLRQIANVSDPIPASAIVSDPMATSTISTSPIQAKAIATGPIPANAISTSPIQAKAIATGPIQASTAGIADASAKNTVAAPIPTSAKADEPGSGEEHKVCSEDNGARLSVAREIWHEVTSGIATNSTALFARIDSLLDPERIEDANLLERIRRKYESEITMRTKSNGGACAWLSGCVKSARSKMARRRCGSARRLHSV